MGELSDNLIITSRNIANNWRTLPIVIAFVGWLVSLAGCVVIWHFYYANTSSSVHDNAVTNYQITLAFFVPVLNIAAYLSEISIIHFLALGIYFANFPQFVATSDFYVRDVAGTSVDALTAGYSLIVCGEIISFFAVHEFWRNIVVAKERLRHVTGSLPVILSIFLLIGSVLMFYDSEQYSLLISIPPLLIADFYVMEYLFSVLGLKYVVVVLAAPGATSILMSALSPYQDGQWKSGAAVCFISLVVIVCSLAYRSIGSEDSTLREKIYVCVSSARENLRKVIPMSAICVGWVACAVGVALLWAESHHSMDYAEDNFLFATMFFVPTINFIAYALNIPLLHFASLGLYYYCIGPFIRGGTTSTSGSWQADYWLAWAGATVSFMGHLEAYKNFTQAKERLVESFLRHPVFSLSALTSLIILAGVITLFFLPEHGFFLLVDMDPLVLGAVFLMHAFVGISGVDYVLMFWAGTQLHGNSLIFALNTNSVHLQVGFSLIWIGLVFVLLVLGYKKIRFPDEPEPIPTAHGYEEL